MVKPLLKTFVIDIKNGKPSFTSTTQRGLFFQFLKQFEGRKVWMTLDTKLPKRTDRQNRFYWLYLDIIAHQTGNTSEELHNAFKQRFLYQGDRNIFGEVIRVTGSTTELSKAEFSQYLDEISILTDVPIPDASIFELGLTHEEFKKND
jgi:hypothetical protein